MTVIVRPGAQDSDGSIHKLGMTLACTACHDVKPCYTNNTIYEVSSFVTRHDDCRRIDRGPFTWPTFGEDVPRV